MKYKNHLIIIAILYGILCIPIISGIITPSGGDITAFIPGGTELDIGITFLVIIPLGAIIGSVLGYFLAPFFLFVHKKVLGRKLSYSIQERPSPEKFKIGSKALFPALMAINFAILFAVDNTALAEFILTPETLSNATGTNVMVVLFILGITVTAAFSLFSSVWNLSEAGIVYFNKEKVEDRDDPIELRSVGGWYGYLLKGYASISVLFSLYQLTSGVISQGLESGNLALVLTMLFFPVLITLLVLPAIVLFDVIKERRCQSIRIFAEKLGIKDRTEIEIHKIND